MPDRDFERENGAEWRYAGYMTSPWTPIPVSMRLRLPVAALILSIVVAGQAADDDFLAPSPFVQATAAFEQGDVARAESLVMPLAGSDAAPAEVCSLLGQVRLQQKRPAEALAQFERAVAKNQASAVLRCRLGSTLLVLAEGASGDERTVLLGRARAELERAAEADGELGDAQMGLMRLYLLAPLSAPADAVERHAAAAARLDPWDAPYEIAEYAEHHDRLDLAERYYGDIADKIPADPWLRFKQASMLAKLGRVAEARAMLGTILKSFAGFKPAQELLGSLPAE